MPGKRRSRVTLMTIGRYAGSPGMRSGGNQMIEKPISHETAFRAVFQACPDALLLLTPELVIVDATDAYLAVTMTRREAIVGRRVAEAFSLDLNHPEAAGARNVLASLQRVLETRQPEEMAVLRQDLVVPAERGGGLEERYWRPHNLPVFGADGEVQYLLHRVEDATGDVHRDAALSEATRRLVVQAEELKAQNRVLKESEERYRALFDASSLYIGLLAADGTVVEANAAGIAVAGLPRAEIIGKRFWEGSWWGDQRESRAMVKAAVRRVAELGEAFRGEGAIRGADGELRYVDVSLTPVRDAEGRIHLISVFCIDLTEKKRAELALARANEELELRHRERIESLEKADQMKDQFLGILSHELRTPLNAIQGFGSVLADGLAGELAPAQTEYLRKILTSSEQMLGLVDDLLDLSRLQAGKFTLDLRTVVPTPLLGDTLAGFEAAAARQGLALVNEVPPALPALRADPRRVSQVLGNLVSNAIKFTASGGTITVRARVEGAFVRVEVVDRGIGILPENHERIFQAFTQVDMTNTRPIGGVGLGLSIVKALVEEHGGEVGVESEGECRGSTFWFTLPVAEPATPQRSEA